MDDNNLRVVLKIHKRSSLEASPSRTWKAQETSTDPSVPNPKRQRTKAISEEHSIVIPSPPKPDSKGASPPADETVAHPIFSSKRKRQLSDSGITDSRPAEQTISGNENRSSLPLKDGKNPLPEKALCEILDKLQKKDLYGVFSVPVNPAEVPDYFDVISHPMDFSTVRGRVAKKLYTSWRQFEDDVSLIWKNAMIYNAEGTIYYKQAKAMQGMAQKIFPAAGSNEIYPRSGFGRGFRGRGRGRGQPGRPKRIPLSDPAQKDTQSGRRFLGQRKDAVPLVDDKQDRLVFGMDERSEVSLSEDIAQTKPAQRILGKGMEKGELLNSQSQPKSSYLGGDDSGNKVKVLSDEQKCSARELRPVLLC
ncbi:unnamed protein product [Closterium sp. NIES-64]|nr:unnamed protein product [Closterium sp. NIES-64]